LFSQSIVGGKITTFGTYPFMALLGYMNVTRHRNFDYECGGTVINKYYVLQE
jgi:secreted trypsin-like serine protease